ncbi:MAG: OPT family oligopeptide transporter [Acidobacteriota bacterium]
MDPRPFQPYVPEDARLPELTVKALLLGLVMAAILGAANAYLGLKAGLTVSATFPAAVVAIAAFRLPFFKGSVLEQNLARTTASVGEALVAGAIFTLPAFLIARVDGRPIWSELSYWTSTWIMLVGGLMGVLFVILLRRTLVEDAGLPFPESAACTELVKAGQHGESGARYVFGAIGLSALLEIFKNSRGIEWMRYSVERFLPFPRSLVTHGSSEAPMGQVAHTGGALFTSPAASPALMAVGYIIGPRLSAVTFSGGLFGWLFLVPLLLFLDPDLARRAGTGDGATLADSVWRNYVRPMAVGAMLVGSVHTLITLRGSLGQAFRRVMQDFRRKAFIEPTREAGSRLEIDISLRWITLGVLVLVAPTTVLYWAFTRDVGGALIAAIVMIVTGFLFAAVGGYLVGLIGGSNQPISGLALSTLVVAALLMVAIGVKGAGGVAAVLGVAAVVCCASSMAGDMIQDLKVGHLLGGTPWRMEIAEIVSTLLVSFVLVWPMMALHRGVPGGIGGEHLSAPQAGLMAQLAVGIVGGSMPWALIGIGIAFGVGLVLIGAPSPMLIAVGMYLPFDTTAAIFVGGVLAWAVGIARRRRGLPPEEALASENRGVLVASGLIAGEALMAVMLAALYPVLPPDPPGGISSLGSAWLGLHPDGFRERWGGLASLLVFAVVLWGLVRVPLRSRAARE